MLQRNMAEIKRIRHGAGLATAGHALGRIRFEQSRSLLDVDGLTDHGIIQFRAVTHQS
ncbi:MAG: hypothetical protein IIA73_04650 [Proteobacteria bacterium]|nr:hypothetical protein [Pseudomonadota bacterium]